MHFNASPWARLMREMSLPWLFVLGVGLSAISVGALFLTLGPLPGLRPIAPLFAVAGGIGVAALIAAVFRLIWAGGRVVRRVAAMALGLAAVGGGVAWYGVSVTQADVWRACSNASSEREQSARDAALAEGKVGMQSLLFRVARIVHNDRPIVEQCAYADTDEARRALGLCPRVADGDTVCRCGYGEYPRDVVCHPAACDARSGSIGFTCGGPPSAPGGPDPATPSVTDRWRARLGIDDLVRAEPVLLDQDYALRLTLRGAAPEDLEVLRERTRALYARAGSYLTLEAPKDWTGGLLGGHVALIVTHEEGDARGVAAHDPRLDQVAIQVDADGVVLQDRSRYLLEINPVTEVALEPALAVTCKGSVLNLGASPIDVVVECQHDDRHGDASKPRATPPAKLSLAPGARASYELHPAPGDGVGFHHVFRERGKDDAPPLETFNRFAYNHARDWLSLHERLRRSVGARFHNPHPSLPPSHADYEQPNLAAPEGWEELDPKKREQTAKEIWRAMRDHYRAWHQAEASTVQLFVGGKEAWVIDGGKLRRAAAP